ncbi:hypothetical protein JTE90_016616 [Oedothorax gibbosus]|uniref:Uncharacterized protein n=1 Tax=Oedothorax gibbosus TaxID=931172 RepID=A0AAV6UZ61_9ARAC|nr:hypothetical protein JTE90_016616 [Oedothorax gibbosus]
MIHPEVHQAGITYTSEEEITAIWNIRRGEDANLWFSVSLNAPVLFCTCSSKCSFESVAGAFDTIRGFVELIPILNGFVSAVYPSPPYTLEGTNVVLA